MSCVHFSSRLWISLIIFAENAIFSPAPLFFFLIFFSAVGVPFKRFTFLGKTLYCDTLEKRSPLGFSRKSEIMHGKKTFLYFYVRPRGEGGIFLFFPFHGSWNRICCFSHFCQANILRAFRNFCRSLLLYPSSISGESGASSDRRNLNPKAIFPSLLLHFFQPPLTFIFRRCPFPAFRQRKGEGGGNSWHL